MILSKPDPATDDNMRNYLDAAGRQENFCHDHHLNTEAYKRKQMNQDDVTCYAFGFVDFKDANRVVMFSGYGDGLIVSWVFEPSPPIEHSVPAAILIGHTNKINKLEVVQ